MYKFLILLLLFTYEVSSREKGQTEITTEEGIEVYQKEKFYILKKNVIIKSDNFNLSAQNVKAHFEKDLYDITDIYSKGKVRLTSSQGVEAKGDEIKFNVKNESIYINGNKSLLITGDFNMQSDGSIDLDNLNGNFELIGPNSKITTADTLITGSEINGIYENIDGENIVKKLHTEDKNQINIKTETLNMFALSADFDKVSQLPPGSKIKFEEITLKDAENLYNLYNLETQNLINQINQI